MVESDFMPRYLDISQIIRFQAIFWSFYSSVTLISVLIDYSGSLKSSFYFWNSLPIRKLKFVKFLENEGEYSKISKNRLIIHHK